MSDLIARLIAAGTPADLIAEVAMLAARAEVDREAIETRRAKDRDRQAARRHVTSRDIADVADITPSPSPSSSPDPSNNPTHTPGNEPRARKGTRLPADWQPGPLGSEVEAIVAPWPPGTVDREMAKFRDFWAAKAGAGGVKSDWQATWRNWLRQADERIPKHANRQQQPTAQHGSRTGYGRTGDAAQRFLQARGHH
ncbi:MULTISPECIES: hypothetical protein [unclassified Sphingomonas]|uniref:hypothetical protein n=1 Tax=unclassified Sphingomonas TaxID=196159 RepID=UPI0012E2007C|nr:MULTISPECIES: hypothetical protein [unclassified Sphingomonas]